MRKRCVLIALALAGCTTLAGAQQATEAPQRYPWDQRPQKCLGPEAASMEPCKAQDWPDLHTASMRFQTLLSIAQADDVGYGLIQRAANDLGRSAQRFPNGEYHFEALHLALTSWLGPQGERGQALMQKWADAERSSSFAQLALALSSRSQAWAARGNGYANTVSPEAWKIYNAKLGEADAQLEKTRSALHQTGPWQIARVLVTWESERLRSNRMAVLEAATSLFPDAEPLYRIPFTYSEPKYGGSMKSMDAIAQVAAKKSGASLYGRLYARHFAATTQYTLADSAVDWKLMKQGFRELESRPIVSGRWPLFAKAACQMRDKDEARRLYGLHDAAGGTPTSTEVDPCRTFAFSR